MNAISAPIKCLGAGLLVTLAQIFVAVCLMAPSGPLWYRYSTLVQHDGYWFANIVARGYGTTVPPVNHKLMEVSNVAFFPAYPVIAGALHDFLHLSTANALLITAQMAAWGFWTYFFLFCARWQVSQPLQVFGALATVAHPAAFFLVAGYSESLFLMALAGFIYWSTAEGWAAKLLAALHGFTMSATRIVGIPCAAYPIVRRFLEDGWRKLSSARAFIRIHLPAIVLTFVSTLGAGAFFLYCQFRWGRWDLYMLTQEAGWAIEPDYLAIFKPASYRFILPPPDDPVQASQLTVTLTLLLFATIALFEFIPALRRQTAWPTRVGFYFCALVIYYVSIAGVASVQMESMLRYQFCVHALVVLAAMHYLRQVRMAPMVVRAIGMAAVALFVGIGFSVQGWYVWNFTRGNWVA
jgi:hypothetical protein